MYKRDKKRLMDKGYLFDLLSCNTDYAVANMATEYYTDLLNEAGVEYAVYSHEEKGGRFYVHVDVADCNVLAVAHCDTVNGNVADKSTKINYLSVNSIGLDDRLGIFIITHVMPLLGTMTSLLLTTDEEVGMSTARLFVENVEVADRYSWAFEVDRRGNKDAAHYGNITKSMTDAIESFGYWTVVGGSFTDVAELPIPSVNFSAGYVNEHTANCHAYYDDIVDNGWHISSFVHTHLDDTFDGEMIGRPVYRPLAFGRYSSIAKTWNEYDDYYGGIRSYNWSSSCAVCGQYSDDVTHTDDICESCSRWLRDGMGTKRDDFDPVDDELSRTRNLAWAEADKSFTPQVILLHESLDFYEVAPINTVGAYGPGGFVALEIVNPGGYIHSAIGDYFEEEDFEKLASTWRTLSDFASSYEGFWCLSLLTTSGYYVANAFDSNLSESYPPEKEPVVYVDTMKIGGKMYSEMYLDEEVYAMSTAYK